MPKSLDRFIALLLIQTLAFGQVGPQIHEVVVQHSIWSDFDSQALEEPLTSPFQNMRPGISARVCEITGSILRNVIGMIRPTPTSANRERPINDARRTLLKTVGHAALISNIKLTLNRQRAASSVPQAPIALPPVAPPPSPQSDPNELFAEKFGNIPYRDHLLLNEAYIALKNVMLLLSEDHLTHVHELRGYRYAGTDVAEAANHLALLEGPMDGLRKTDPTSAALLKSVMKRTIREFLDAISAFRKKHPSNDPESEEIVTGLKLVVEHPRFYPIWEAVTQIARALETKGMHVDVQHEYDLAVAGYQAGRGYAPLHDMVMRLVDPLYNDARAELERLGTTLGDSHEVTRYIFSASAEYAGEPQIEELPYDAKELTERIVSRLKSNSFDARLSSKVRALKYIELAKAHEPILKQLTQIEPNFSWWHKQPYFDEDTLNWERDPKGHQTWYLRRNLEHFMTIRVLEREVSNNPKIQTNEEAIRQRARRWLSAHSFEELRSVNFDAALIDLAKAKWDEPTLLVSAEEIQIVAESAISAGQQAIRDLDPYILEGSESVVESVLERVFSWHIRSGTEANKELLPHLRIGTGVDDFAIVDAILTRLLGARERVEEGKPTKTDPLRPILQIVLEPFDKFDDQFRNEWTGETGNRIYMKPERKINGFRVRSMDTYGHSHWEGYVTFQSRRYGLYISDLATAQLNRGGPDRSSRRFKGLGTLLVTAVVRESIRQGHKGVVSGVTEPRARAFLVGLGFGGTWKYWNVWRILPSTHVSEWLIGRFLSPEGAERLLSKWNSQNHDYIVVDHSNPAETPPQMEAVPDSGLGASILRIIELYKLLPARYAELELEEIALSGPELFRRVIDYGTAVMNSNHREARKSAAGILRSIPAQWTRVRKVPVKVQKYGTMTAYQAAIQKIMFRVAMPRKRLGQNLIRYYYDLYGHFDGFLESRRRILEGQRLLNSIVPAIPIEEVTSLIDVLVRDMNDETFRSFPRYADFILKKLNQRLVDAKSDAVRQAA